jgi:hypothetical protein
MNRSTEQLIRELAGAAQPVRPLACPHLRAGAWLVISLAYIGLIVYMMPARPEMQAKLRDPMFITEELAAIATGIAAAIAAFATIVPGFRARWAMLPLLPLTVWLASLGPGCLREFQQFGFGIPLDHSLLCLPSIVLLGAVPAVAMAVMLRRGAPLTPYLTAALGGLAAAGIGNAGVRLVHPEEVTVMLLVWHVGSVMALSILAGSAGRYLLKWPWTVTRAASDAAS